MDIVRSVTARNQQLSVREAIEESGDLLPYPSEEALRRAFSTAHDLIYKHLARDPAASFDLLALVVAAKVLDEQGEGRRFAVAAGESADELCTRLESLLLEAQEWLDFRTDEIHVLPTQRLLPELAKALAGLFEGYSLTLTADSLVGADALGTAYEAIVGATFRGELGAYFTPRGISEFIAQMLDVRHGRVFDPACGTGGLLIAAHRHAVAQGGRVECFGNDINPRMVHAARVNFLLHQLDRQAVLQGDGLGLGRMLGTWFEQTTPEHGAWWNVLPEGPFDAVVANPPFAGHEQDPLNLERIATALVGGGGVRSLNRTLPFLEVIVASLKIGGQAGIVLPTSILNAEEQSFVRFRELLLEHVEIRAIVGLPERAFVHTDCGVHGALLFVERVERPRESYDIFVAWADQLGYDRLGREIPQNDLPRIVETFRSTDWPAELRVGVDELRSWGRFDPAWIRVARTLPTTLGGADDFVALTELFEVRQARISRRSLESEETYRYFEVADTDLETGEIVHIHEARGWELQRKSRIKNLVRSGDVLLPNHRDSLIAKRAPTGRSAVIVGDHADGVLTTDRFIVLEPKIDRRLLVALLNSAGVRRQLVAQSRGAASLEVRESSLATALVPRHLVDGPLASTIAENVGELRTLRVELANRADTNRLLIDEAFRTVDT
jgi:type I restriction-modification system DNA methylase subunit